MQQHAALRLAQRGPGFGRHDHVRGRRVDDVGQLPADARRIEIDRSGDFQVVLGQDRAGDESPDGAEPHQHDLRRHGCVPPILQKYPPHRQNRSLARL